MKAVLSTRQEACITDVVRTVAYFAANGWVPTGVEVWRWMDRPSRVHSLHEVLEALEFLRASGHVRMQDGRFCFPGSEHLIKADHAAYRDAQIKMRRARRVAAWAARIPGVRGIAVANTLAWEHTRPEGDIDFFVVARAGTLWFVRLCAVGPLLLLRARPGVRRYHPIDFTFFISESCLDLSSLCFSPDDPYLAHWATSLVWLVDDGVALTFYEQNDWAFRRFPNAAPGSVAWYDRVQARPWHAWGVARWLNAMSRVVSRRRFPEAIRSAMNHSTSVVATDDTLKFHVTDRRQEISETWTTLCKQHGNAIAP